MSSRFKPPDVQIGMIVHYLPNAVLCIIHQLYFSHIRENVHLEILRCKQAALVLFI